MRVVKLATVGPEGRQGLDAVLVAYVQELVEALDESFGIVGINQEGEEYSDGIESKVLRHGKFLVYGFGVETLRLPHLDLVDGGRGDIVASHDPSVILRPFIGFFFAPAIVIHAAACSQNHYGDK